MKKKLLVALFVAIMVCIFALTASAANEVTLTDGTTADFATVFKINSNNEVTGFNSGYDKDMVTDVIFPDEIAGLEANFLFGSAANLNTITFAATDTFFISGDGIFSKCSVKTITFNPNCLVEIRKGNFSECTSLTSITFPKFKKLAGSSFKGCSNMVSTNDLVFAEGMTEIGGHAFNGCTSLTGTVYFPSTLETIQEYSFQNTGFTNFDLSKCSDLTVAGGGYGGPFTNNDKITTLDLSGCTSLTYLKSSFAADCDNLTTVILPPNLEEIQHKAFAHCYKLQSLVLPDTMVSIADEAFHSARSGQSVKTFTMYVQSDVKLNAKYVFRDSGAKIEFVLLGDSVTAEQFKTTNAGVDIVQSGSHSPIDNIDVVDYVGGANPWSFTPGETRTSHVIVENYCTPLALTGSHASDDNPCVIYCTSCLLSAAKENPQHVLAETIKYENGYTEAGVYIIACTSAGCQHKVTTETNAIIRCIGYSASENGKDGISLGFRVDNDAIKDYMNKTGKTVSYGLFAATKDELGDNNVINDKGEPSNGAVIAEIPFDSYVCITIKLAGFKTDELKASLFAIGAYVAVSENGKTEYSYMQSAKPTEGNNYFFETYNDIVK